MINEENFFADFDCSFFAAPQTQEQQEQSQQEMIQLVEKLQDKELKQELTKVGETTITTVAGKFAVEL